MGYEDKDQEDYDLGVVGVLLVIALIIIIAIPAGFMAYLFHTSPIMNMTLKEVVEGNETIGKGSGFKDYNYQNNNYKTGYIAQAGWKHNYTIYTVKGASMEPTMFHNDNIICDNRLEPKLGDIVLINNSMPIAHRIIAEYPRYVITKGDNRITEDESINKSQIICVIVGVLY